MLPWLLISGDFTPLGGMDSANHALAKYLAQMAGGETHLVTNRAWEDLAAMPRIIIHPVWRHINRHLLRMPLLDQAGRRWARRLAGQRARVVVNGGNCRWADINWVHYVHAAHRPHIPGSAYHRLRAKMTHVYARVTERVTLRCARLIICN